MRLVAVVLMVVMAPVVVAAQQSTSVTIGGTVRDHGADLYLPDVLCS